jgi:TetR/AcrR family transcriptional regulator, cholesterol catabolism regulator
MRQKVSERSKAIATNDEDGNGAPTQDRVMAVAAQLFRSKGYAATTTREIAAQLGIQKASLYYHISRKEDLLFDIVVATTTRSLGMIKDAVAAADCPMDKLKAAFHAQLQAIHSDLDKNVTALTEMRSLEGERLKQVVALRDEYDAVFNEVISACQAEGSVRRDLDARLLALSALSLTNWSIVWFTPGHPLSTDQLADALLSIFLEGATATSD